MKYGPTLTDASIGWPLQEMDIWLESFRGMWVERFDRLDQYLQQLQMEETDNKTK